MMENTNTKPCRWCGADVPRMSMHCENCRQSLAPDAVPDLSRLPKCPVCKIPIFPAKFNTHNALHCEECEGTAVAKETLMKLQAMEPKKLILSELRRHHVKPPYFEPRDKPPFLICPFCNKKMLDSKLGTMNLDMCEKCGAVWFDRGKEKHINDMLGPYKMKRLKSREDEGRRRR